MNKREENTASFVDKYRSVIWLLILAFGFGSGVGTFKTHYEIRSIQEDVTNILELEHRVNALEGEKKADVIRWERVDEKLQDIKKMLENL